MGPACITLEARGAPSPTARPPVRIFLASEPAQHRAERVFVWSVERVRDPARSYEIHLMKGLQGFQRRGWTTGFTNYRYAIPHFAGGAGRAIYNDVDQIYLSDPAELFDTDLAGHGFLALAPDDPSVMLIDCARMGAVWTLDAAQVRHKSQLLADARRGPDLYGALAPEWNARDGEYREGRSKLIHYTNLHTQPWCPFPERFVYQGSEQAAPWFALERSADAAGFEVFTREQPSSLFPQDAAPTRPEAVAQDDLPWFLDELFRKRQGRLRLEIDCDPAGGVQRGPDGDRETPRTASWWAERFGRAAARHREVRWELALRVPGSDRPRRRSGGPREDGAPPRVWVLTEDRPGNTTQAIGLAEALGWPWERKELRCGWISGLHNRLLGASLRGIDVARSAPLEPPWPDLVIAAGRRTAPVALWIREQSGGHTRLVQLGRKGGDQAASFDLVVSPSYCGLYPHPHRIETHAPLHSMNPARLAEAALRWKPRLEAAPAPRIAVLVGGSSGQYRLDRKTARRLGEDVSRLADATGGSLFASTSRRTGPAATAAFRAALGGRAALVHCAGEPGDNPYPGLLALADAFVITGDSESMLAEACSRGKPVSIYPLPTRTSFRALRFFRDRVVARAAARPAGPRGTGRPQRGLEYLCARLVERGFVRPTRDLDRLHDDLIRRGVAQRFGAPTAFRSAQPLGETQAVAERVRRLLL